MLLSTATKDLRTKTIAGPLGTYTGQHDVKGFACGQGIIKYESGITYAGTFMENVPHGFIVQTFPDGSRRESEFRNGCKSNFATFYDKQ